MESRERRRATSFFIANWRVDPTLNQISRDGVVTHLRPQLCDLLALFAEHPNEVLSKEQIFADVWPGQYLSESTLKNAIGELRQAFGDTARTPTIIENIPKRGYRLVAPTRVVASEDRPGVTRPAPGVLRRHVTRGRALALGVTAIAAAAAAAIWITGRARLTRSPDSSGPTFVKTIAVLPLRSESGSDEHAWLAESLTQELTSALARRHQLRVISGISARHFKGTDKTARQIARELGSVEDLLEGAVSRDGDTVRISLYVDNVASNRRIWSDRFDGPFENTVAILDDIAGRIEGTLTGSVTPAEDSRSGAGARSPAAYEEYLRGLYLRDRQMDGGCASAERHFVQAIALDPRFAAPHAALAFCYGANRFNGELGPNDAITKGHAEVNRALALDSQSADAYVSLAMIQHRTEYDWAGAERSFTRALALNPGDAEALVRYGEWLYLTGHADSGLLHIRRGITLTPFNVDYRVILGYALYHLRRYPESLTALHEAQELDPNRPFVAFVMADSYAAAGDAKRATAALLDEARLILVQSRAVSAADTLDRAFRQGGIDQVWRHWLVIHEEGIQHPNAVWRPPYRRRMLQYQIAREYARLGESDRAIAALEAAYRNRDGNLVAMRMEPLFDRLQRDERFQEILRRVGPKR